MSVQDSEPEGELADERITVIGLVFETAAALERALGEQLRLDAGMTLATFEILIRLGRSPRSRLPHHELSRQLSLSSGGITRMVDRLEQADLVCRERDPQDKRVYYVTLTDTGQAALKTALPGHLEALQRLVVDQLGAEGFDRLQDAVRPLRDSLIGDPS